MRRFHGKFNKRDPVQTALISLVMFLFIAALFTGCSSAGNTGKGNDGSAEGLGDVDIVGKWQPYAFEFADGKVWELNELANMDETAQGENDLDMISSLVKSGVYEGISMEFLADGSWHSNAGDSTFEGTWKRDGNKIDITSEMSSFSLEIKDNSTLVDLNGGFGYHFLYKKS